MPWDVLTTVKQKKKKKKEATELHFLVHELLFKLHRSLFIIATG